MTGNCRLPDRCRTCRHILLGILYLRQKRFWQKKEPAGKIAGSFSGRDVASASRPPSLYPQATVSMREGILRTHPSSKGRFRLRTGSECWGALPGTVSTRSTQHTGFLRCNTNARTCCTPCRGRERNEISSFFALLHSPSCISTSIIASNSSIREL